MMENWKEVFKATAYFSPSKLLFTFTKEPSLAIEACGFHNYNVAAGRMVSKTMNQTERYLRCQLGTKQHRPEVNLLLMLSFVIKIRAS